MIATLSKNSQPQVRAVCFVLPITMASTQDGEKTCAGCKRDLGKHYLKCSSCDLMYNLDCANVSDRRYVLMTPEHKRNFVCQSCLLKRPKTDNTNTPIRPGANNASKFSTNPAVKESHLENVTLRNKKVAPEKTDDMETANELKLFREDIRAFRSELVDLKSVVKELSVTFKKYNERFDALEGKVVMLENKFKELQVDNNESLQCKVAQLELAVQEREQELLQNDIEISGISESKGENPVRIVMSIAQKLGTNIDILDIVSAERVGPMPMRNTVERQEMEVIRPRPIVVRLTRRAVKEAIIHDARVRRGATTEGLELPESRPSSFFINERLSKFNRQLFHKARARAKQLKWRYVWTREGRIYVRQQQSKTRYRIKTLEDITRVFGEPVVGTLADISRNETYNE